MKWIDRFSMDGNCRALTTAALLIAFLFVSAGCIEQAQWQTNGVPVCTAPDFQLGAQIVSDGDGGAIMVWQDERDGWLTYDIYAQRVDVNGNPLWLDDGAPVCMNPESQSAPTITPDGAGGAIIAWLDGRSSGSKSFSDIYAQRLSRDGEALWLLDGVPVCVTKSASYYSEIVLDGTGGAIITWEDHRNPDTSSDIYIQKLDSQGNPLLTPNGAPLCRAQGNQGDPMIITDGSGGAVITWIDERSGQNGIDIFAQRIDSGGAPLWAEDGIAVCTSVGDQIFPGIVSDGSGGAIIAWHDERWSPSDQTHDIYAQRIDHEGNPLWDANGIPVCTAPGNQFRLDITSDRRGGAIIGWDDNRAGEFLVYIQKVDGSGAIQWAMDGIAVSSKMYPMVTHAVLVTTDGNGGAIIAWMDSLFYPAFFTKMDLFARKYDSTGKKIWGGPFCMVPEDELAPRITSDGRGGAIVVWQDHRYFQETWAADIFAQKISDVMF